MKEDTSPDRIKLLRMIFIIFSVVTGILFVTLTVVAMHFYPGGYSFVTDDFSVLGRFQTESNSSIPNTLNPISSTLFCFANVSSGIILVLFWITFRNHFQDRSRYVALSGTITGIISSLSLIGVGVFPMDIFPILHGVTAIIFFVFNAVTFILYAIAIFLHQNYPKVHGYGAIAFIVIAFLYVSGAFLGISPLIQKICVYYFILWTEVQNINVLKK
ncbi:MAG: DUF998 domain-containing protein [Candidatus Lokiarchaeota archaeon]|nr:DUF998 domain-containing protein [Candidatus Lokiarchaeota archaeon]